MSDPQWLRDNAAKLNIANASSLEEFADDYEQLQTENKRLKECINELLVIAQSPQSYVALLEQGMPTPVKDIVIAKAEELIKRARNLNCVRFVEASLELMPIKTGDSGFTDAV